MNKQEHHRRLVDMLKQVAPPGAPEGLSVEPPVFADVESFGRSLDRELNEAAEGLRTIAEGRELTDEQAFGLEAIVLPKYRPVVDIVRDDFGEPPSPWTHLASGDAKGHLQMAIPSIGRVEVPGHPRLPYAGTAFVVGPELLMTNRHVAEVFCTGLGMRRLILRREFRPGIDFVQEVDPRESVMLEIRDVMLIHPHWDMALVRVSGLEAGHPALRLGVAHPEDLLDHDIAVIGYPAQDPRNDFALQYQIFRGVFDVKRLQPGKLKAREHIVDSFGNRVHTVTHDASTLGGNSGSAVIDVSTGEVVGLHFGGRYLQANYAVPTYELARDHRVVDAGVNFVGQLPSTDEWEEKWQAADVGETSVRSGVAGDQQALPQSVPVTSSSATLLPVGSFTLPLHVTVSVGSPVVAASAAAVGPATPASARALLDAREVPLRIPVIYDELDARGGYDPGFLELDDDVDVPLPALSAAGRAAAARLDNGSTELKYHKFSIVMHKGRRLALLTAANVDWREDKRRVDGRKPSRRELTGIPDGFGEQWVTDPRIPDAHQLPDIFFTKDRGAFDKGHLVRRDDVCWGDSFEDIQMANGDTFHTTNCSPQVAGFNQATRGEFNWGDLENLVQQETNAEKAVVLAGPVFAEEDPEFRGRDHHGTVRIRIPQKYWKIIVVRGEEGPAAYGFVLAQDLGGVAWELAVPAEWEPHTLGLAEIEALLSGLVTFGPLRDYDQTQSAVGRRLEESLAAVRPSA
jgi:endonuclease G